MKFPIFILALSGAAANQLERFIPRDWRGELVEDLFQAQWFASAADAARRLEELTRSAVRSDLRAVAIYQISGMSVQRLSQQEYNAAKERALDEDLRSRMTPETLEYFQRAYTRRPS